MIDFNLNSGGPVQNDEISLILQQIDLLFDTTPKEVLGDNLFGTNYERFLHQLNISNAAIQQQVLSDLNKLELFDFIPTVEIHILQGTENDIILVEINLNRDDESYQRIYKIS
jgi:hypothetical protein